MTQRTHTCGQLNPKAEKQTVTLLGWVHRRRDHGGLVFIDLRDRWGLTQVVFSPEEDKALHQQAEGLRPEFCVAVKGQVRLRPKGTENPKIATGMIEVVSQSLEILNESATPPFEVDEEKEQSEELRFGYRYLDLRRPSQTKHLIVRHQVIRVIREVLDRENFLEIETPVLTKSTPEGARDYLVPSRLNPGKFYALPQSPQLYKQLLMVAGVDRYYQIARCFRDEDLRADRQPEFTQLDLEMSFVDEEGIFTLMEKLFAAIWKQVLGADLKTPFPRLTYDECMERFGTDKPDVRFGMTLTDLTPLFSGTNFKRFQQVISDSGVIRGLAAPGGADLSAKETEDLIALAQAQGAKGMVPVRVTDQGLVSPVAKHLEEALLKQTVETLKGKKGDLILLVADSPRTASAALGAVRSVLAERLKLIPERGFHFTWITGFPLFQRNATENRWDSEHHPFTAPFDEDLSFLESDPGRVRARSYDLVLNGMELGSGSIRIHRRETQEAIFRILALDPDEVQTRFGFLLDAFRYGAPPHGGIAPGIDRLIALITGAESIREVIAFPKTQKGVDLMMKAPDQVSERQLKELGINLKSVNPLAGA